MIHLRFREHLSAKIVVIELFILENSACECLHCLGIECNYCLYTLHILSKTFSRAIRLVHSIWSLSRALQRVPNVRCSKSAEVVNEHENYQNHIANPKSRR